MEKNVVEVKKIILHTEQDMKQMQLKSIIKGWKDQGIKIHDIKIINGEPSIVASCDNENPVLTGMRCARELKVIFPFPRMLNDDERKAHYEKIKGKYFNDQAEQIKIKEMAILSGGFRL